MRRRNEIFTVRNAQGVHEILVVEFEYAEVPMKVTIGSPTSCPVALDEEPQVHVEWANIVKRARRMKNPFIIRSYVPVGHDSKLLIELGSMDSIMS